ncbi:AraC family transcriptional regulator [Streptomyces caeni]|uniref:AraC family transcriptional regulator n=1 Tax=Streptomyces caeni TaxID=2307231 RepID=A0ABW4J2Z0_9ACTN
MPAHLLPLATHERFHTHDLDEARGEVGRVFCPHGLNLAERGSQLDARLHAVAFDRTGLYYLDYGTEVRITPGALETFFLVQIPLAGTADVSCGHQHIVSTPELASVPSPTEDLSMRWAAASLIVWVDRSALEAHLGKLLARPIRRPITFHLGMDLTLPASRSWLRIVDLLRKEADNGVMPSQPLMVAQLEGLLMTQLLLAQSSNYSPALLGEQPRVAPLAVRRAMELIEAHAAEPLTVEDIATAVGVGVRALQEGFQRHLGTTPLRYLRDVRLGRAQAELTASDPGTTTVTDIAFRWGFFHSGRFSIAYRQRFGESPSETLRR